MAYRSLLPALTLFSLGLGVAPGQDYQIKTVAGGQAPVSPFQGSATPQ